MNQRLIQFWLSLYERSSQYDEFEDNDLYSATVGADEENYSYCNRATNYPHLKGLKETLNSSSYKDVRIGHINVYSLWSKVDGIHCLQRQCKFEILSITETHLDSSISDAVLNIGGMKKRKGWPDELFFCYHWQEYCSRITNTIWKCNNRRF